MTFGKSSFELSVNKRERSTGERAEGSNCESASAALTGRDQGHRQPRPLGPKEAWRGAAAHHAQRSGPRVVRQGRALRV